MTDELKQLVEDAAKLLDLQDHGWMADSYMHAVENTWRQFNPLDPERGDLMKVAEAAGVSIRLGKSEVTLAEADGGYKVFAFIKGDYQSIALAILCAASTVLHSRGGKCRP